MSDCSARPGRPGSTWCCSGSGPTGIARHCSRTSLRWTSGRASVVGVPEAGLEPFVPRVSMTLPRLANARQVVFLATGASKADAVAAAFGPDAKPDPHVPSSLLAPLAKEIKVLLDPAAAGGLGSPGQARHDLGHRRRSRRHQGRRRAACRAPFRRVGGGADRPIRQRGADRPARGDGEQDPERRPRGDRHRRSVDRRVRHGTRGVVGEHPVEGRSSTPGARGATRRSGVRRQRRDGGGARRGARRGASVGRRTTL